jgi:prepilin signal peptidase PulO-like enzyme (type II secretory pathway)
MEIIIAAIIGACFGSFITAASYRLPREENLISESSKCPKCNHKLGWRDLFPIFSWLFSGAKCRYCEAKVSARYPLTELVTAGAFAVLYWHYGATLQFALLAILTVALLILIISDLETYIIPDTCNVLTAISGVLYQIYITKSAWTEIVGTIIFAAGLLLVIRWVFTKILKREAMGLGDIKFTAAAAIWLGINNLPLYLIIGGSLGIFTHLVWRIFNKNPEFPFGPALAIALYILVLLDLDFTALINAA